MPVPGSPEELTVQIDNPPVLGQHYGVGTIALFCRLVIEASVSLAAASHVLRIFFPEQDRDGEIPHPTTGRMWLLRLGLFKLQRPKTSANDWVWLTDHIVLQGKLKCLMIAGVRLSQLPPAGCCLQLQDLEPIAILPVEQSNQHIVQQQLQTLAEQLGAPRALLSDEGSDLAGGERLFCQSHPETVVLSDIAHFAARLLKCRLEKNERWKEFCQQAAQTKSATGQTELAFLSPPNQRSKARFMNLGLLLGWAERTLAILDRQPADVMATITPERLEEKFGWLGEFRSELAEWSQWQTLTETAIDVVRRQGYSAATPAMLQSRLAPWAQNASGEQLRAELADFVAEQSAHAQAGERFPGSTEIFESSFGKLKRVFGDQQKGGFTHLLLSYAALLGETTNALISEAMQRVPIKQVLSWCRENLGATLQSLRTTARLAQAQENLEEP